MKWHRAVVNGLVSGLFVSALDLSNAIGEFVVLVLLCTLLTVLGIYDNENN